MGRRATATSRRRGTAYFTTVATPVGDVHLAATEQGLCALGLDESRQAFVRRLEARGWQVQQGFEHLQMAARQVREYLEGGRQQFHLPLDLDGLPPFQQRVLRALLDVPAGQVLTYGQLARQLGQPRACRAVGRALAANPIPLVVPCHRVVRSDGGLGGYSAGLPLKARLLEMERKGATATNIPPCSSSAR